MTSCGINIPAKMIRNCGWQERLMESPDSSEESKAELRLALYNPVELNRKLNEVVENLLKLNREKGYTGNSPYVMNRKRHETIY
jgi:hypothetical protein